MFPRCQEDVWSELRVDTKNKPELNSFNLNELIYHQRDVNVSRVIAMKLCLIRASYIYLIRDIYINIYD